MKYVLVISIQEIAGRGRRTSGMVATMRSIGQLVSLAIAMMAFSLIIGTAQITPAVHGELEGSYDGDWVCLLCSGFSGQWYRM